MLVYSSLPYLLLGEGCRISGIDCRAVHHWIGVRCRLDFKLPMLTWCSAEGIKSNVGPLVAEQYINKDARVSVDSRGRRVIIDPVSRFRRYSVATIGPYTRRVGQSTLTMNSKIMNMGACSGLIATVTFNPLIIGTGFGLLT